jgi:hypothetical protein
MVFIIAGACPACVQNGKKRLQNSSAMVPSLKGDPSDIPAPLHSLLFETGICHTQTTTNLDSHFI